MIGRGESLEVRPQRRLTEDQADPGRRGLPPGSVRIVAEGEQPARAALGEYGGRRPLTEASEVFAEPCLDRSGRPALEALDEASDHPERILEGIPRVAFAELGASRSSHVTRGDAQGGGTARLGGEPARREDRVEEGEAERGKERRRPQVALDAFQDGAESDQLAPGVQVEQLVGQAICPGHLGESGEETRPHRGGTDVGAGAPEVVGIEGRLALLGAAPLIPADRAAIVPGDRPCPARDPRLVLHRPDDLVGDKRPAARGAARREEVADRGLQARFTPRGGCQALEGRVEMADVGRAQDYLGEHPRERARLERDRPPLAVDGETGDPAAPAEEIGHDVAGTRMEVDPGRHHRGRRGGRDAVEDG